MKYMDWEARLNGYLADVDVPSLGAAPCAKFVSGAVAAQVDRDIHAPFDGKYVTPIGAAKALVKYGAGTLEATFDSLFDERPIGFAQRGDVIFNGEAVGLCIGAAALFIDGDKLVQIPRANWIKAWAVG